MRGWRRREEEQSNPQGEEGARSHEPSSRRDYNANDVWHAACSVGDVAVRWPLGHVPYEMGEVRGSKTSEDDAVPQGHVCR